MRRVALASAALAFCLPAQWVAGASAAVACLTAATGRRLGASARLGVAIVASATRLDSTLSQELPHALARVMAHATRSNARLASARANATVLRSRQSTGGFAVEPLQPTLQQNRALHRSTTQALRPAADVELYSSTALQRSTALQLSALYTLHPLHPPSGPLRKAPRSRRTHRRGLSRLRWTPAPPSFG